MQQKNNWRRYWLILYRNWFKPRDQRKRILYRFICITLTLSSIAIFYDSTFLAVIAIYLWVSVIQGVRFFNITAQSIRKTLDDNTIEYLSITDPKFLQRSDFNARRSYISFFILLYLVRTDEDEDAILAAQQGEIPIWLIQLFAIIHLGAGYLASRMLFLRYPKLVDGMVD